MSPVNPRLKIPKDQQVLKPKYWHALTGGGEQRTSLRLIVKGKKTQNQINRKREMDKTFLHLTGGRHCPSKGADSSEVLPPPREQFPACFWEVVLVTEAASDS